MTKGKRPRSDARELTVERAAEDRRRALTDDELLDVEFALRVLRARVRTHAEAPPPYLLKALRRFAKDERAAHERLAARVAVIEAHDAGAPLTDSDRARSTGQSAYEVAALRVGRLDSWVRDAYKYPRGRKKR
jgi:hypothetical protein